MAVGGAKETTMITLVRAMALAATACTAAALVIALRAPQPGGPAVPVVIAPAASRTASHGPGLQPSGGPGPGGGVAGLAGGGCAAGAVPSSWPDLNGPRASRGTAARTVRRRAGRPAAPARSAGPSS
jgi:hypothetical protein